MGNTKVQPHEVQYMHNALKNITAAGRILRDTIQKDTRPPVKHVNAEEELVMVQANLDAALSAAKIALELTVKHAAVCVKEANESLDADGKLEMRTNASIYLSTEIATVLADISRVSALCELPDDALALLKDK